MKSHKSTTILFAPDLVPLIRAGSKTLTYRLDDDHLGFLRVGDRIEAEDSASGAVFAELEIVERHYTTFGELPIGREGNVAHPTKEDQRAVFKGYYSRDIMDSDRVLVLGFRVVRLLVHNC
jgi:ASC-1-like (ASCH) protein